MKKIAKFEKVRISQFTKDWIESFNEKAPESSLVTVYNTGIPVVDLMKRFGIKDFFQDNCIDNLTINLTRQQLNVLKNKAPYLIAMSVNDLSKIPEMETTEDKIETPSIPEPSNEPTIGVIDTLFDEKAYFSKWVTNHDLLKGTGIPIEAKDYFHGTSEKWDGQEILSMEKKLCGGKHEEGCQRLCNQ